MCNKGIGEVKTKFARNRKSSGSLEEGSQDIIIGRRVLRTFPIPKYHYESILPMDSKLLQNICNYPFCWLGCFHEWAMVNLAGNSIKKIFALSEIFSPLLCLVKQF